MWFPKAIRGTQRRNLRKQSRRQQQRQRFLAALEKLEDRLALAASITIIEGAAGTGDQDANLLADGQILFADPDIGANTLTTGALAAIAANIDLVVEAESITFSNLTSTLTLQTGSGNSARFSTDTPGGGAITFANTANTLATSDGDLIFVASTNLTLGNLDAGDGDVTATAGTDGAGDINLAAITSGNTVSLTAIGGAIVDINDPPPGLVNITAVNLSLDAETGIGVGAGGALETQISNLEAFTDTGGIFITNNGGLTIGGPFGGVEVFTSGNILLTTLGSIDITQEPISTANGNVVLNAQSSVANIVTGGSLAPAVESLMGNVSLTAGRDILVGQGGNFGDLFAEGNVVLQAGRDVTIDSFTFVDSNAGDVIITAGRDINLTQVDSAGTTITTQGGDISLTTGVGGTFTLDVGNSTGLVSNGGDITITADEIVLESTSAINADAGIVTLRQAGTTRRIDLGAALASEELHLSQTELDIITASLLRLGRNDPGFTGNIILTAPINANTGNYNSTISFFSGGSIGTGIGGSLVVTNVAARGNQVSLNSADNQISNIAGSATILAGNGFQVNTNVDLNVGTVDGISGITGTNSDLIGVSLGARVAGTTVTVSQPIQAVHGFVELVFDNIEINAPITASTGPDTFADSGTVRLAPFTLTQVIDLGGAAAGADLDLTDAELDRITAEKALRIGSQAVFGNIQITSQITQAGSGYTTLGLWGSSITDATAGEQVDITVDNLGLRSRNGIGSADDLNVAVSNLAFDNLTSGAVNVHNTGSLNIAAVDGLTASRNASVSGLTFITATSPLTFLIDTMTVDDAAYLAEDTSDAPDLNDDLTINAGVTVEVTAGDLTLIAGDDIVIGTGAEASASGAVSLVAGFGDLDGGGGIVINGTVSGNPVDLAALDDICVGNIDAGAGTVSISSVNGAILDCDPAMADDIDITAAALALSASMGVGIGAGTGGALETQVANLEAAVNIGGVFINNGVTSPIDLHIGGVSGMLNGVTAAGSGNIELINNGSLILDGASTENVTTGFGSMDLQAIGATANVEVRNGNSSTAIDTSNGNIEITAGQHILLGSAANDRAGGIDLNGNLLLIAGGDIVLDESSFISTSPAGTVTAQAGGDISILATDGTTGAAIRTTGGAIQLTTGAGGTFTAASGATAVDTTFSLGTGADITINADDIVLTNGLDAGTGIVTLQQASTTRQIDLGTNTAGTLGLTDAELDLIMASLLRIGRTDSTGTGFINVTDAITGADGGYNNTLSLRSGADIRDGGDAVIEIVVANLALQAATGIGATGAIQVLDIDVTTLAAVNSGSGGIFITDADTVTIGDVDGVSGVSNNNARIQLFAFVGDTTVNSPVSAGAGEVFVGARAFLVNNSSISNSGGELLELNAPGMDLSGGTVTAADGGTVLITTSVGNTSVDLGSTTDTAPDTLELSDAELDTITTTGVLKIGPFDGSITISSPVAPANVGTLSLETLDAIVDGTATEQDDITVANLALRADSNIGSLADLDLDLAVSILAMSNANGPINVTNNGPLTIGTVDGLVGSTNSFGTTITATGPLVIAANVTDSLDVTLTAVDSADTGDDLTVNAGVTVQSFVFDVVLNAGDNLNLLPGSTIDGSLIITFVDFGNADPGVGGVANIHATLDASTIFVTGDSDSDTFSITPDDNTPISVKGNDPTPPAVPGDRLSVDTTGTTGAMLTSMATPTGLEGEWTFSDRATVSFVEIESLLPSLSIADVTLDEGNSGTTQFVFTVSLDVASTDVVTVVVSTADGTAVTAGDSASGGNDYAATTTTLTFAAGETTQQVTVLVNGDTTFEADETFFVNLSGATNALIGDAQAEAVITNEDALPALAVNDVTVAENSGNAVFTVSLTNPSDQQVTVVVATADGTAVAAGDSASGGNDYQAITAATLTFLPGQTTQQVTVVINGDATFEADETYFVNLSVATNASIDDPQGQGVITNDDQFPVLAIDDVTVVEGGSDAVFTVSLTNPSDQFITVAFTTADGSALDGADYQGTFGTLSFAPGETALFITVSIVNDAVNEPDEQFVVNLSSAVNANLGDAQGIGTIRNRNIPAYAVGADAGGGPHVRVFSGANAEETLSFFAFAEAFTGGVRVAMGDVNRDGTPDIIAAAGPGGGPHVRVFDGITGLQLPGAIGSFFAYEEPFRGGVYVASADFNNDGFADILTGAGPGGGPHIRVFSGADGSELTSFFDHPKGTGGVRVATGDMNGDGTPDIIAAPGAGAIPATIHIFDGLTDQLIAGPLGTVTPYPGFLGGIYVAAGDIDGDNRDDLITGAGAGGGPHVRAFSGLTGDEIASFFAYDPAFTGGVRVAVGDVNLDDQLDIITGAGPGGGPHVRAFNGGSEVASFFAFNPGFAGGVFVGGAASAAISVISPPEAPVVALLAAEPPASNTALLQSSVDEVFSATEWLDEECIGHTPPDAAELQPLDLALLDELS